MFRKKVFHLLYKGHPDGTTRHTHRGERGGRGGGARERCGNRHQPHPPRPAACAAHTRPGHCTRQGSSGTQCHAPAPQLGSLCASPWGSHWRTASSTGPAAPAPRATTHWGGGVVGKLPQPLLLSDALTREPARKSARCGVGRTHSQWVAGPSHTAQRTGGRRWESAHPGRPTPRQAPPPPAGALMPPPQRAKPARMSARCGVGDGSLRPQPPHPQPPGGEPRPHPPKDGRSGGGERPTPDAPHPGKKFTPPGALVPPPQCAKPALKSARCGVGDGSPRPQPPQPQPVGSRPRPHAPKDGRLGVRERPTPDASHPGERRLPRATSCRPHSAQSQYTKGGLPAGGHATPGKARGRRDRATPHEPNRRSTESRQETRRGSNRLEPPYWRPAPETRVVRAPHRSGGGGVARTPREHERTHTQRTHGADLIGNRTEPAERTDQMEWHTGR